jgi:hypothetical protein
LTVFADISCVFTAWTADSSTTQSPISVHTAYDLQTLTNLCPLLLSLLLLLALLLLPVLLSLLLLYQPCRCAPQQHQALCARQGPQVREGSWSQEEPWLQGISTHSQQQQQQRWGARAAAAAVAGVASLCSSSLQHGWQCGVFRCLWVLLAPCCLHQPQLQPHLVCATASSALCYSRPRPADGSSCCIQSDPVSHMQLHSWAVWRLCMGRHLV